MKLLAASLLLLTISVAFSTPPAAATAPVCLGYSACYAAAHDGYAIACVENKGHWICFDCESCGNGPWLP